ncbi:MAG: hypothetical protein KDD53_02220 [Bdellovibrionales bacterium]|nr:hypothetical protein [Bdellovibrionales bacterium]
MNSPEYSILTLGEYQRLCDRFEKVNDGYFLPDTRIVVRIDAHRFGPKWENVPDFDYPFDESIREALIKTAGRLMTLDLRVSYCFIHGDEISLLLDPLETAGLRRRAKLVSHVASAGSVFFTEAFGAPVFFRAKVSELPSDRHLLDYFFWQRKVARRNYVSRTISQLLTAGGADEVEISKTIAGLTEEGGAELLAKLGLPIESVKSDLLYGIGLYWQVAPTGSQIPFNLICNRSLPDNDSAYCELISSCIAGPSYLPELPGLEIPITESAVFKAVSPTKKLSPKALKAGSSVKFRLGSRKG